MDVNLGRVYAVRARVKSRVPTDVVADARILLLAREID